MGRRTIRNVTMSKRYLKRCAIYCCVFIFLVMVVQYLTSDDCFRQQHVRLLCQEYTSGNIAGAMCYDLCVARSLHLGSCSRDKHGNLVYIINDTAVVKMRDRYHDGMTSFHHVYQTPEEGINMDQFRAMVHEHLNQHLGESDHSERLQQLMNTADVNKDDKVSLAEAKTLWALLKQNEFLILQVMHSSFHVPQVPKFCGEAYMMTNLPPSSNRQLYRFSQGLTRFLFPGSYTWGFPSWVDRSKIAVGLLEFALDVYQHQSDGSFYLCDMNETNIGFSQQYDFLMEDFSNVLPRKTLESKLFGLQCVMEDQCLYTEHCKTLCDKKTRKCTGQLVRPNLALICDILKPYLLPDMPKVIRADFLNLIFKCTKLQTLDTDFEVQHSLIINDLRSLLWRHIRSEV